jgi:Pectate lyase superfamily protein
MPIKQLPTIGDSNWGTTLNNYLLQTTDNTQGGGFNSFTNFADRPTNLTADDKGKTYLNRRTNNFHVWTGTVWEVRHVGGFINVQDIGKAGYGDGADDSLVVKAALDTAQSDDVNRKLFFPNGNYRFEVEVRGQPGIVITGESAGSTQISAINPDGYAFTFHANGLHYLQDISIYGRKSFDSNLTYNTNGVKCVPKDAAQNAGYFPVNMNRVIMRGCGIALYKEATLYGRFDNCDFGGDIGVFCKGSTNNAINNNYSGFDYFTHCQFRGGSKAAIYYNNAGHVDESQTKFENCWFEGISGIVCLAIGTGTTLSSLKFDHCWFEANTSLKGQNVTIDGASYVINSFIFKNSKGTIEHGNLPNGISLTDRSYLKLNYVQGTNEGGISVNDIQYDASSYVDCGIINDVPAGGYGGAIDFMMDFAMRGNINGAGADFAGTHFWRSRNQRPLITRKYKNLVNFGSCSLFSPPDNGPYSNSSCTATIVTDDGLYNNKCLQVTAPNGSARYGPSSNFGNTKPYVAFSMAIKSDQATATNPVDIRIGEGTWGHVILRNNNWHTYCGIIPYHGGFFDFACENNPATSFPLTYKLSKIQCVDFDTYQEATEYVKSDFYALPAGDPISWHDSAIPTSGTYAKGDRIWNTNPVAGGSEGWVCITAGSPGVWKTFGSIGA